MPFTTALRWSTLNILGEPSVLSLPCSRLLLCVCWVELHFSPPPSQWRATERYLQSLFQGSQLSSSLILRKWVWLARLAFLHAACNKGWGGATLQVVCLHSHVSLLGPSLILRPLVGRASVDMKLHIFCLFPGGGAVYSSTECQGPAR